ncbi:hypothetical protein ACSAZK_17645 [Methanosarcina sp. Mfa9]|uniref:hypothetical protein n=1 Tax=Methanosarcina sp. Mfa9 TaxID=3439063 RepID=UPI003F8485EA
MANLIFSGFRLESIWLWGARNGTPRQPLIRDLIAYGGKGLRNGEPQYSLILLFFS